MHIGAKIICSLVLLLVLALPLSYCEVMGVGDLVEKYAKATDVQRRELLNTYQYTEISAAGIIANVMDYPGFDQRTDTSRRYYEVITEKQMTKTGIVYDVMIIDKDKASVDKLSKGEEMRASGALIKIIDNIGSFSVWIYTGELTPEDKSMLVSVT
ncbi:MAG: hypothetical protein WC522_08865 [Candidatus Omnitrophota bacterium]